MAQKVKKLQNTAIPAALFPQYWRGVLKNCFVHLYSLTGLTGAMRGCQAGEMQFFPLTVSANLFRATR
jgi:hypothetical protein